jgi:hypothetical protein
MAIPGSGSFSFTNMLVFLDVLYFRIFLCYSFFVYFTVTVFLHPLYIPLIFLLTFLASVRSAPSRKGNDSLVIRPEQGSEHEDFFSRDRNRVADYRRW